MDFKDTVQIDTCDSELDCNFLFIFKIKDIIETIGETWMVSED